MENIAHNIEILKFQNEMNKRHYLHTKVISLMKEKKITEKHLYLLDKLITSKSELDLNLAEELVYELAM